MNKIFKFILFLLLIGALVIIGKVYLPVIGQEIRYQTQQTELRSELGQEIVPISTGFGLVIPKIGINVNVVPNVDQTNPSEYLPVLAEGVAHAKGTALPGREGVVLIFAHSADSPLNITRYNADFYLLGKLNPHDEIQVYFQGRQYLYQVLGKKVLPPEDVRAYFKTLEDGTLVLQTCTPPGTSLNRLLIVAQERTD